MTSLVLKQVAWRDPPAREAILRGVADDAARWLDAAAYEADPIHVRLCVNYALVALKTLQMCGVKDTEVCGSLGGTLTEALRSCTALGQEIDGKLGGVVW